MIEMFIDLKIPDLIVAEIDLNVREFRYRAINDSRIFTSHEELYKLINDRILDYSVVIIERIVIRVQEMKLPKEIAEIAIHSYLRYMVVKLYPEHFRIEKSPHRQKMLKQTIERFNQIYQSTYHLEESYVQKENQASAPETRSVQSENPEGHILG